MESKQRVWESLRNDARQADSLIERQIAALEAVAHIDAGPSGQEFGSSENGLSTVARLEVAQQQFDRQRVEVELALQRFETLLDTMAETARALPPESAAQTHTERFLQLAAEKRRTVARIAADFKRRREWAELLPSVTNDLETHREGAGVRVLMEEQDALRHTQRRLHSILEQADSSRDKLRAQRDAFLRMEDHAMQIVQRIPLVKSVLSRIDSKRRRDAVVLGGVIGICLFLTVFFV
ncbi:golgi SNARE protein-like [Trypanosoma grayi]|uniref:golgi SNARE protein-like n=1 Tax=Trypanosoma grayi TaxID=71804 RepID=UPI0004F47E86|nr:golgi SNARE protein-like [Trypanosoma grayi]KEG07771.1 golgi SNARE protein-like [Trypanosoma grayi]